MRLTPDFERTLKAYVLGNLDEDLRVELEELLVTDPDAFEALGVIEDELVEEYLDGTGSPSERRSFEERYLASPK
jgi:anti-sigma factor RsiW